MAWESNYVTFGVTKIDRNNVKVYKDRFNYVTVNVGKQITNANWAGGELNITLSDGKVRRYKDRFNYTTI